MRKIAITALGFCMMFFAWQGDGQAGLSLCVEENDAALSVSICEDDGAKHVIDIEPLTLGTLDFGMASYAIRKYEPDSSCCIRQIEAKLPGDNNASEAPVSMPETEAAVIHISDKAPHK